MKNKKSVSTIGLDIGNYSVKCVQVTRTKDKITLDQLAVAVQDATSQENLVGILNPFLPIVTASPDRVRVVLSGSALLVRCVQMPAMTQAELKSAIRFEAENHIAFPIDDCILDFQILNEDTEKKTMNVLLVAAKRDFIQERLRMLHDMDIRPEAIDVDTFSLVNAFEALSSEPAERTFGLINVGHRVTSFAILREGLPLFVRDLSVGGSAVTGAIAALKNTSEGEAEKFKLAEPADDEDKALLKAACSTGFEALVEEIRNSIQYFENEQGEAFQKIWLSGGGSIACGAAAVLSEALGKEVAVWDNMKKLVLGPAVDKALAAKNAPALNIALGLALRT